MRKLFIQKFITAFFLTAILICDVSGQNSLNGISFQGKTTHSANGINVSLIGNPSDSTEISINGFDFNVIGSGVLGLVLGLDDGTYIESSLNGYNVNGLSVGLTTFNSKMNGVSLSPIFSTSYYSNGVGISLINFTISNFTGIAVGGINFTDSFRGIQIGGLNWNVETSGIQIGIFNRTVNSRCVQFGLLNYIKDNPKGLRILPFMNMRFKKRRTGRQFQKESDNLLEKDELLNSAKLELLALKTVLKTIDSLAIEPPIEGFKTLKFTGIAYGNVPRANIDNPYWKKSKKIVPDSVNLKIQINKNYLIFDAKEYSNTDGSLVLVKSKKKDLTANKLKMYRGVRISNNYYVYVTISYSGWHGIDYLFKFSDSGELLDYATSSYVH